MQFKDNLLNLSKPKKSLAYLSVPNTRIHFLTAVLLSKPKHRLSSGPTNGLTGEQSFIDEVVNLHDQVPKAVSCATRNSNGVHPIKLKLFTGA